MVAWSLKVFYGTGLAFFHSTQGGGRATVCCRRPAETRCGGRVGRGAMIAVLGWIASLEFSRQGPSGVIPAAVVEEGPDRRCQGRGRRLWF